VLLPACLTMFIHGKATTQTLLAILHSKRRLKKDAALRLT
jgi:hypothetical protein